MITDEINNVMLAARSGKAPVALSGHILLLNWNQQVRAYPVGSSPWSWPPAATNRSWPLTGTSRS
jgi:hypothetical protein